MCMDQVSRDAAPLIEFNILWSPYRIYGSAGSAVGYGSGGTLTSASASGFAISLLEPKLNRKQ